MPLRFEAIPAILCSSAAYLECQGGLRFSSLPGMSAGLQQYFGHPVHRGPGISLVSVHSSGSSHGSSPQQQSCAGSCHSSVSWAAALQLLAGLVCSEPSLSSERLTTLPELGLGEPDDVHTLHGSPKPGTAWTPVWRSAQRCVSRRWDPVGLPAFYDFKSNLG